MSPRLIDYCSRTEEGAAKQVVQEAAAATTDPSSEKAWLSLWALGHYSQGYSEAGVWSSQMGQLSTSQRKCFLNSLLLLVNRVGPLPADILEVIRPFCSDPCPFTRQLAREVVSISSVTEVEGPIQSSGDVSAPS